MIFLVLMSLTIWYLSAQINSYDLRFYSGKDNGYFVRLQSICILSTFFWTLMTNHSRIKYGLAGFFIGLISAFVAYFSLISLEENATSQVIFHLLACFIFMTMFFILNKIRTIKNNNS